MISSPLNYAQAPAEHLQRPFVGAPAPPEWHGLWRSEVNGGDVELHILTATRIAMLARFSIDFMAIASID
jgi:hypothetical protein